MLVDREVRTDPAFKYLDWYYSAGAVLDVYRENQKRAKDDPSTIAACSESWTYNDRLRQEIHQRACTFWCVRTGLDHTYFPLSVDAVSRLYLRYRKRTVAESKRVEVKIEEACKRAGKIVEQAETSDLFA